MSKWFRPRKVFYPEHPIFISSSPWIGCIAKAVAINSRQISDRLWPVRCRCWMPSTVGCPTASWFWWRLRPCTWSLSTKAYQQNRLPGLRSWAEGGVCCRGFPESSWDAAYAVPLQTPSLEFWTGSKEAVKNGGFPFDTSCCAEIPVGSHPIPSIHVRLHWHLRTRYTSEQTLHGSRVLSLEAQVTFSICKKFMSLSLKHSV